MTRIIRIVAFKTASSNKPRSYPISAAANVAAAWATVSPNTVHASSAECPESAFIANAASPFAAMTAPTRTAAVTHADGSDTNAPRSTIIPTESRKNGMNRAWPTKTSRFISVPCSGTRRLRASPAKNAPTMASTPATSARNDTAKTTASTNTNPGTPSSPAVARKNHRPRRGTTTNTNAT